jgi:hypothetical protein
MPTDIRIATVESEDRVATIASEIRVATVEAEAERIFILSLLHYFVFFLYLS